jgi:hypothetical protein
MIDHGWELYVAIGATTMLSLLVVWLRLRRRRMNSPEWMSQRRRELEAVITEWRYLDGSLIPQHKRSKLMAEYVSVSRRLKRMREGQDPDF